VKDLDSHTEAALRADLGIENLDAAIAEARRRVTLAEEGAQREAMRAKAQEVLGLIDRFRASGPELDALVRTLAATYAAFEQDAEAMRRLGALAPNAELIRANSRRALLTLLIGTPLRLQMLAPGERRDFTGLADGWADGIAAWADHVLAAEPEDEAA
jgi:hypothetical protein